MNITRPRIMTRTTTTRTASAVALSAALAVALCSCSSGSGDAGSGGSATTPSTGASTETTPADPQPGGTLTFARTQSPTSLDLHREITANNAFAIDKVFEPLLAFDAEGQIEPWLAAFEALDARLPVVVVCQDSRTAARLRSASTLDVLTIARYGRLDDLLGRSDVKLALYVSHSARNFECLRFTSMVHVYLGHGDSDKGVSASNQVKAYDYCFVAGRAAVERIARNVHSYDADARCVAIGQPQLDVSGVLGLPAPDPADRPTILYAPTWEGAQPSVAYSSVLSHGETMVRSLVASGRWRVLYRPHPLTGVTAPEYARADERIRALVEADAGAGHRVASGTLAAAVAESAVLLSDVSGVVLNWLPTGRPIVLTEPAGDQARVARTPLTRVLPTISAQAAADVDAVAQATLTDEAARARREELIEYYLTDVSPGAATARFGRACEDAARERDDAVAALARGDRLP